jgi:hypothetical protein
MSKSRSFRSQILNWKRIEGLIQIYFTIPHGVVVVVVVGGGGDDGGRRRHLNKVMPCTNLTTCSKNGYFT